MHACIQLNRTHSFILLGTTIGLGFLVSCLSVSLWLLFALRLGNCVARIRHKNVIFFCKWKIKLSYSLKYINYRISFGICKKCNTFMLGHRRASIYAINMYTEIWDGKIFFSQYLWQLFLWLMAARTFKRAKNKNVIK